MSDGTKRPYAQVLILAAALVERLKPACERIEIAGSLRRQRPLVGDIELIAIPKIDSVPVDLFGATEPRSHLDELLDGWMDAGHIRHADPKRWGDKLKAFAFDSTIGEAYKVDLFIQPDPATWGVNMMIRTGNWRFSKWMVTSQNKGGAMPDQYRIHDARVWCDGEVLPTPEERDVFALWGLDYIDPKNRER